MSLRDQLLKAGLVSQEKVKKVENETRRREHQGKKGSAEASAEAARRREADLARQQEAEMRRQRDRELNAQREADRRRKEATISARQIITSNRANDPKAEERYNFPDGRFVRSVRATPQQQRLLAMGKLGLARNDQDRFDFPLLPREAMERLQALRPDWVVLLYPETDSLDDDDWPE